MNRPIQLQLRKTPPSLLPRIRAFRFRYLTLLPLPLPRPRPSLFPSRSPPFLLCKLMELGRTCHRRVPRTSQDRELSRPRLAEPALSKEKRPQQLTRKLSNCRGGLR